MSKTNLFDDISFGGAIDYKIIGPILREFFGLLDNAVQWFSHHIGCEGRHSVLPRAIVDLLDHTIRYSDHDL
jgi:hypothetical protein